MGRGGRSKRGRRGEEREKMEDREEREKTILCTFNGVRAVSSDFNRLHSL